ncbi:hypothetical protein C922_05179 [Plasmodium inui San Antonio 1]|uniref:Uncharacterized protein n=1 Tax=Plasmodium inui San Antonio 1 TaxID=1237626 RepID=W6ZYS6_9APIC|nr:hypothetical protein C922_05179 [Plasmodium inui San Antonio 1]EUD64435.1 hypothetical protein C922_05179 [Plasmodium inui San Antonio 1]
MNNENKEANKLATINSRNRRNREGIKHNPKGSNEIGKGTRIVNNGQKREITKARRNTGEFESIPWEGIDQRSSEQS